MTTTTTRTGAHALGDGWVMLRRTVLHMRRYPSLTLMLIGQPIIFLLLFTYVFGGTMGAGLPGAAGDTRGDYLAFIAPGILAMTVAFVALQTAVAVAMDMTSGVIARFRTMNIAKVSVLTGHVLGAMLQTAFALVVVLLVALLLGYRPGAGFVDWLVAAGVLAAVAFALTWLTVAMGLAAPTVESASNTPMVLVLLPFLSSAFVPTDTLPAGIRHFADHQPFTPAIDAVRTALDGGAPGSDAWVALGWCALIGGVGYLWTRRRFGRIPAR